MPRSIWLMLTGAGRDEFEGLPLDEDEALDEEDVGVRLLDGQGHEPRRRTRLDEDAQAELPRRDADGVEGEHRADREALLQAGEEPLYIARRVVRMAVEDIGLADPNALAVTLAARDAVDFLGQPEGDLALAQAVVYLCAAPKSNAANWYISRIRWIFW